jgi:hypothetical protein
MIPDDVEQEWLDFMVQVTRSRAHFYTQNGSLGLGPKTMQAGDLVCVLIGGHLPFALRRGLGDGL